jgi:hypothetical protein
MTKKKSPSRKREPKYEEITVNDKRYILHKITWEDITGDSGHANTTETKAMKPAIKITYGFIVEDNDKDLITASTYDTKEDEWSDRNVFPTGCVVAKKKLEIR